MTSMDWTPKRGTWLMAVEYTTLDRICVVGKIWSQVKPAFISVYLTVILGGRAGYELIYITNAAVGRVGYYQLISGKSEKNNCFSKFSSNSQLISSGETSANRDIFFPDDAAKFFFPTSTRNSPSVFLYLVKLNDNDSYDGLREPIRKLENHYHELKIY